MTSARASASFFDMTPSDSKSLTFFSAAMRAIDSTPESMRHTPRLPASMGHSSE